MKRRSAGFIILTCLMMLTLTFNAAAAENPENTRDTDAIAASVIVTSGDEFILKVSSTSNDADLLAQVVSHALGNKEESEITPEAFFCCAPNQPTEDIRFYFHTPLNDGTCETYDRVAKQCLTCGAEYPMGPKQNISTHKTTSSCPK